MSMFRLAAIAVASVAVAGPAFAAEAEGTAYPLMDEAGLVWKRMPKLYDMARFYPTRARVLDIKRGLATLNCTALATGKLDCVVAKEEPTDVFFGEAALKVIKPATVQAADGGSPEGRRFSFTFRFGYWPPATRQEAAVIGDTGLRWVRMAPVMKYWDPSGLKPDEWFWVEVTCEADAEGALDCVLSDPGNANKGYTTAVLKAFKDARVTTTDGSSPAGKSFVYRQAMSLN